jgi:hypothetical protein
LREWRGFGDLLDAETLRRGETRRRRIGGEESEEKKRMIGSFSDQLVRTREQSGPEDK